MFNEKVQGGKTVATWDEAVRAAGALRLMVLTQRRRTSPRRALMKETTRDAIKYAVIAIFLGALALIMFLAEVYGRLRLLSR